MSAPGQTGSPPHLHAASLPRGAILVAALVLVLGALAAYSNSFSAPFVYDDIPSIVENPTLRQLWPLSGVLSPPHGGATVEGRPLLNLSFAVNYAFGGLDPRGYHAVNLLIHACAGLVLFGLVRRTFLQPVLRDRFGAAALPLAFTVAVLWTWHPLQTESVTYLAQRTESLMGLLFLLVLYGFLRGVQSPAPARWLAVSVAACALGMATKENMVAAPVMALLFDRAFVAGSFRGAWQLRKAYYLSLAATWLLLAALVANTGGDRGGSRGFGLGISWWDYELTQFPAIAHYLALSAWPTPLVFDYGPTWVQHASAILPQACLVVALVVGTLVALGRNSPAGFLGALFFAILAPTSLVPARTQMIVEHRMYLPLIAVVALVVAVAFRLGGRRGLGVLLAVAVGFGWATFHRNVDYRSDVALWQDTVAKGPANALAHGSLGGALAQAGRNADAIAEDQKSIQLEPNYVALNNLGSALTVAGRPAEALPWLEQSLRQRPDYAEAHLNLGVVLDLLQRSAEALPHYAAAVRVKPFSAQAQNNLGEALSRAGQNEEGLAHLAEALRLQPDFAGAHYNLAAALARAGRLPEAQAEFETGHRLQPGNLDATLTWGNTLLATGHAADARAQYESAIRQQPGSATAHYNLGRMLAGEDRLEEARRQFAEAVRLRPDYAEAHDNLGNSLLMLNREAEAVPEYEAALRLDPKNPAAHNNLGLALARLGKIPEAAAQFEAAVQLAPNYTEARENLAHARAQLQGTPP